MSGILITVVTRNALNNFITVVTRNALNNFIYVQVLDVAKMMWANIASCNELMVIKKKN